MKSSDRAFIATLLFSALLIFACRNPMHELDPDIVTLRVRATTGSDVARTVVADFSSQIDEIEASLTSNDGYAAPTPQKATAAPWQVSFSIPAGSWNIAIVARRSGVQVGAGSLQGVALKAGLVDPVTVPVAFGATETGGVRFAVSVPGSTGVDYIDGLIEETGVELAPALTSSSGRRSGVFEFSSLAGGTYTLVLTFKRGGSRGTVAGVFHEKLIVTAGFTSGSWVGPGGVLLAERAFSETEFASPGASLAGLVVVGVFDGTSFSPSTLTYDNSPFPGTLPSSVTFTATLARSDQYLEYSWNGGAFQEIRSETASPALTTGTYNILGVRVTAPDRSTSAVYWVTFGGDIAEGGPYSLATPEGSIGFTLSGGKVIITSYSGTPTSVAIPASVAGYPVTRIVEGAFDCCTSLTSIVIPDSVTTIGHLAFGDCTSLTSVVIPDSVTTIGPGAFYGCTTLTSVVIPDSVTTIAEWAFYQCASLTSVVIPDSVTSIGENAFEQCTSLISVVISDLVKTIGWATFNGCTSLTSIVIPDSVTTIGEWTFAECTSLTSVVIPDSVTTIGFRTFSGCTSLIEVHVRASSPPAIGGLVFYNNASRRKIYVPAASLSAYQTTAGWSDYAASIVGE